MAEGLPDRYPELPQTDEAAGPVPYSSSSKLIGDNPIVRQVSTYKPFMLSPGAMVVALVALFVPWATYMQLAPWTTPVTLLTYILGALLVGSAIASSRKRIGFNVLVFLMYIALVLFSRSWTIVSENWFNAVFWWIVCFLSFAGAIRFIRTAKHVRLLVYLGLLGALISGMKLRVVTDDWGNVLDRLAVQGHNMNFTSYALSGVVVLSLVSTTFIRFPILLRVTLPFVIAVILYFQLQLGTRGAVIASVSVIMLHVIRGIAPAFILRSIPVLALVVTILVPFGVVKMFFGFLDSTFGRGTGDLSGRAVIWADAVNYIADYPITGIGPNAFAALSFTGVGAHNFVLTILLETGIIGGTLFFIFFFNLFRIFKGILDRRFGSYLAAAFSAYWFPLAASGHWETSPLSWIVVASFIRIAYLCRDSITCLPIVGPIDSREDGPLKVTAMPSQSA